MTTPVVFVSYSHDDLDHKRWVLELSTRLRKSGVDVILDQWDLTAGQDLASFMSNSLEKADRVLMVCTPNYVAKANEGKGGVGVERMILTAEYLSNIDSKKVIPVIKKYGTPAVPIFFQTKLYIDFSKSSEFEASFDDLLRNILEQPLIKKPEIGLSPFDKGVESKAKPSHNPILNLMKIIIDHYEKTGRHDIDITRLHNLQIASSRTMTDIIINQALQLNLISRDTMNGCVWLEDEGKLYAVENELIQ